MKTRKEQDALGEVEVPAESYGGSFYARAKDCFQISDLQAHPSFARALCQIKMAAAIVNREGGRLRQKESGAIFKAGEEFLRGDFDSHFDLDVYQAGAGTPFNMNMNEILANRANEILGGKKGEYKFLHPNDDVNMSQSSNDVIPTAIRLAALHDLNELAVNGKGLVQALDKKSKEFADCVKVGRTHLQDAVPVTLGQEFGAYAASVKHALERIMSAANDLKILGIGGTAVGSGINADSDFAAKMCEQLEILCGERGLSVAENKFESTHSMAAFLSLSAALRGIAVELLRISNDLRMMAGGPIAGINEIVLPEVEPGSSIMPGKVNPSIPECLSMICIQVIGLDQSISLAAQQGQFELNWHTPLIMTDLLHQVEILTKGMKLFADKCVSGIKANKKNMKEVLMSSTALATALAPHIGYKAVAKLVQESLKKGVPFSKVVPAKYKKYLGNH